MSEFTFLEESQITGDNKLDIFKKYGTKCAITDFAILLGGYVSYDYHTSEGNLMIHRTGWYWTQSNDNTSVHARIVNYNGFAYYFDVNDRTGGGRPALPYSSIKSISSKEVRESSGVLEVKYGEYPQTITTDSIATTLETMYKSNSLAKTGKKYTTDSQKYDNYDSNFSPRIFEEYQYNGQKYIRFVGDYNCKGGQLSDEKEIKEGKAYWIKVEPIVWQVDEKADIAITKKIMFSGIQFNKGGYDKNFNKTNIKRFMNYYFGREIIDEMAQDNVIEKYPTRQQNPYNFNMSEVSEEDIIKSMVESNVAVFLHGRSSEGKSARVKQLDPDLEIVYLRNATPDSLNGKSVYNSESGEMIDVEPTWYKKLKAKCEAEKDKLHILFFDEITNALPSIQGMAFNIILDKEVNGIWKLPDNCRIVAAGNDIDDSLAANQLAEPLFNRFAHVYIETKVNDWLNWASTSEEDYERLDNEETKEKRMKIHPSIYAFIAYKGEKVLRTKYTGDKPNADPRKWELASKVLYKSNNPYTLRALVGEDITKEFVEFCKIDVITLEDVLSGNYNEDDLDMNVSEKYATVVGLSMCEEKDIEVVREFISKLGKEILATFGSLWCHGDVKRLEKLAELNDLEEANVNDESEETKVKKVKNRSEYFMAQRRIQYKMDMQKGGK